MLQIAKLLQEQRVVLIQNYHKPTIINDADDVGKLAAIAQNLSGFSFLQAVL